MTKLFIRRDSLEDLDREDIVIVDNDNDVWTFPYGAWQSQMNNAWPDSPKLPVWQILDSSDEPQPNPLGTRACGHIPEEDYSPCDRLAPRGGRHYNSRSCQSWD